MADARGLYARFFERMRAVIDKGAVAGVGGRRFAVLAVLWPSKKFADQDLIPSGAAGAGSPITDELLKNELDAMKGVFDGKDADATLDKAIRLVAGLEDSAKAQAEFADLLRALLPARQAADDLDAADAFRSLPGGELIKRLGKPLPLAQAAPGPGGAAAATGGAAGLGQIFSGIKAGALNLLNLTTYYQMKERAGQVGSQGLNPLLQAIQALPGVAPIKLHLIGHSFGGRLVTAAVAGPEGQTPLAVDTLTLLQTAFSHYGFAQRYDGVHDGYFRKVMDGRAVRGPGLVSFTKNDLAVGKAYPLASLIAGQAAAALGDENDKYGGIGRNGALKTPEASSGVLLAVGAPYPLSPGKLHNLNADAVIKGHSDICHDEVAYAILAAVSAN
jgi:hypothetical protein